MLTDIFAYRYAHVPIWTGFSESERRLITQGFRILAEQICRFYGLDGQETHQGRTFWTDIHSRLSMELGVTSLSPTATRYSFNVYQVCEHWAIQDCPSQCTADRFIKERLSLVEIGFRKRGDEIAQANARLPLEAARWRERVERKMKGVRLLGDPGDPAQSLIATNEQMNALFRIAVDELNTRFRQAGCPLNYHNGFIQISADERTAHEIEKPFWTLVADPQWSNVDIDMKEAIDRRDAGSRDPAFYAAKALESTIKIISNQKGWTYVKERGAHNFIENLSSHNFIAAWEAEFLKSFFSKVRNPMGHGPGEEEIVSLTDQQTNWAIEF